MPHTIVLSLSNGKRKNSFSLSFLKDNKSPVKFIDYIRKVDTTGYFITSNEYYDECLEDIVFELNHLKQKSSFYNPVFIYELFSNINEFVSSFSEKERFFATEIIISVWNELTNDVFVDYEDAFHSFYSSVFSLKNLKKENKIFLDNKKTEDFIFQSICKNPQYFIDNHLDCFDFKQLEKRKNIKKYNCLKNKKISEISQDSPLYELFFEFSSKKEWFLKSHFWKINKMKHLDIFRCFQLNEELFLYGFELKKERCDINLFLDK